MSVSHVAGFAGPAPGGPVGEAVPVFDWRGFARAFGEPRGRTLVRGGHLAHAVRGFFLNGGCKCWVVRVEGEPGELAGRGTTALAAVDEVGMVAVPDAPAEAQKELVAGCEAAGDRMAILHAPPDLSVGELLRWRREAGAFDSSFAALYYPWIGAPPSGHVAGVWARTDLGEGVHRPPEGPLLGVTARPVALDDGERSELAAAGVNAIAEVSGRLEVAGARTVASDNEWKYVQVRRLFIYIEESIDEATQWAVFEPNDERLWERVRTAAEDFLTQAWHDGLLAGRAPDEAFFARCDRTTMTQNDIDSGRLVMLIGIAPVKPAEFVILRISQIVGGGPDDP